MYTTVVLIFLLYVSVVLHEMAHLIAFRNKGLKVREFSIGTKKGPRFSYIPKTGKFAGLRFSFYPCTFFLGAFVEVEDRVLDLPYKDRALGFCAGPFANIHFGCFLYLALYFSTIFRDFTMVGWGWSDWLLFSWYFIISSPYLWVCFLIIPTLWFGRKMISAYLGPILGILLILTHFLSVSMNLSPVEYVSEITGPIGFVADLPNMAPDMWSAVEWAAQLSFGLAAINLLPIPPFDGGYVVLPFIKKISPVFGAWYQKAGFAFLAGLMIFIFAKDIINYAGYPGLFFVSLISILVYLINKNKK